MKGTLRVRDMHLSVRYMHLSVRDMLRVPRNVSVKIRMRIFFHYVASSSRHVTRSVSGRT